MEFLEYQLLAKRTATPQPDFVAPAMIHYHWFLGMVGELSEVATSTNDYEKLKEELGDFFWYVVNFSDAFDVNVRMLLFATSDLERGGNEYTYSVYTHWQSKAYAAIGTMAEMLKKHDWYQNNNKVYCATQLASALYELLFILRVVMVHHGIKFSDVFEANIAKLKARYPEGFDA